MPGLSFKQRLLLLYSAEHRLKGEAPRQTKVSPKSFMDKNQADLQQKSPRTCVQPQPLIKKRSGPYLSLKTP